MISVKASRSVKTIFISYMTCGAPERISLLDGIKPSNIAVKHP